MKNSFKYLIAASIGACLGVIAMAFCIAGDDKEDFDE